ncbi:MAG: cation-efflux pump [Deltaproteobacteria bacterium]|nr:cation-efflux pump [Deltaproteobacteria bacterium]
MKKSNKYNDGEKITWIGIFANLVLALVKLVAGIFGKSEALIADAAHSLSDLLSDFVVLASLKIARRPIDEDRPYGYGRVETVGTGVLGIILIVAGIGIFWDALITIREGIDYLPTYIALAGAFLSILVKEILYRYTVRVGERTGSPSVIANAWHHRSDAFSSVATFVGIGAAMMGWPIFDPLAAIIVTVLIVKAGWNISRDSFRDIIDTAVEKDVRNNIIRAALSVSGALSYHDLKTRKTGSEILVDIHIEVDSKMNVMDAHNIADGVRDSIIEHVRNVADVLVHIDPEGENDGIIYSVPDRDLLEKVRNAALGTDGIKNCRDIRLHYVENNIIVNLSVEISPELTIKEGYARVAGVKRKIMEEDRVVDTLISVELPGEVKL